MRDSSSLHCLLDDDAAAVRIARRRRLRSLAVSTSLQALFVGVVVVAPMLATGRLPVQHWEPPVLLYRGRPEPYRPQQHASQNTQANRGRNRFTSPLTPPTKIPPRTPRFDDEPGEPGIVHDASISCLTCSRIGLIDPPIGIEPRKGPIPPVPEHRPAAPKPRPRISEPLQEAKLIHRVDPTYPPLCRQMRLEGRLVLRAVIGRDGTMSELTYVSGPACFIQHSMNAVSQWRYRPTILNGEPVEVETTITVVYILSR